MGFSTPSTTLDGRRSYAGDHEHAEALHEESLVLCRELGDRLIASESMEGLACTAGTKGEAERAARLFGAAEALREAAGYRQAPRERRCESRTWRPPAPR